MWCQEKYSWKIYQKISRTWKKPNIFLSLQRQKNPRGPTTDVSKVTPGFMIQMDFSFFIVESIRGFTSTFVAICSAISHLFGFLSRSKCAPLDILKHIVTTLRNKYKKDAFNRVDEDGALATSYKFMNTCHNMSIIVQTTGVDA